MALPPRIQLNALRAVEAVLRLGTLARAAAELGVSAGAVSQQLRKAEDQLHVVLFERTAAGLVPTPAAQRLAPGLTAGLRQVADAVASVSDGDGEILTITTGTVFASRWLVPRLSRFARIRPDLQIRFVATADLVDLSRSDVDIAIRLGAGPWPGVRAELLTPQRVFPVCAPALRDKLGHAADLGRVPVVVDEGTMFPWRLWFDAVGIADPPRLSGPSFTDPGLALEATIAGQGVMLAWDLIAADGLANGCLVRPFEKTADSGLAYWFVTAEGRAPKPKVRQFRAWLLTELGGG